MLTADTTAPGWPARSRPTLIGCLHACWPYPSILAGTRGKASGFASRFTQDPILAPCPSSGTWIRTKINGVTTRRPAVERHRIAPRFAVSSALARGQPSWRRRESNPRITAYEAGLEPPPVHSASSSPRETRTLFTALKGRLPTHNRWGQCARLRRPGSPPLRDCGSSAYGTRTRRLRLERAAS